MPEGHTTVIISEHKFYIQARPGIGQGVVKSESACAKCQFHREGREERQAKKGILRALPGFAVCFPDMESLRLTNNTVHNSGLEYWGLATDRTCDILPQP
jgi:hypothetical protein